MKLKKVKLRYKSGHTQNEGLTKLPERFSDHGELSKRSQVFLKHWKIKISELFHHNEPLTSSNAFFSDLWSF